MRGFQRAPLVLSLAFLVAALAPAAGATFPEEITQLLFDTAGQVAQSALPDSTQQVVLAGEGIFHAERTGKAVDCQGAKFELEASHKVFNSEPTITLSFGGGTTDNPALAFACGQGHTHQPTQHEVTGSFEGAWSATKVLDLYWFTFSVSAPHEDGTRSVTYEYHTFDGTANDTFQGTGVELR